MTLYLVRWEINIEADNPLEAAEIARKIQQRRTSEATVFDVFEPTHGNHPRDGTMRVAKVDLTYPEETQHFTVEHIIAPNDDDLSDTAEANTDRSR